MAPAGGPGRRLFGLLGARLAISSTAERTAMLPARDQCSCRRCVAVVAIARRTTGRFRRLGRNCRPTQAAGTLPVLARRQPVSPAKTIRVSTENIARFMSGDSLFALVRLGGKDRIGIAGDSVSAFIRHRPDNPQSPENRQNRFLRQNSQHPIPRNLDGCRRMGNMARVCGPHAASTRHVPWAM